MQVGLRNPESCKHCVDNNRGPSWIRTRDFAAFEVIAGRCSTTELKIRFMWACQGLNLGPADYDQVLRFELNFDVTTSVLLH